MVIFRLTLVLTILFALPSCNMSRWYFRHGGKLAIAKNEVRTEKTESHHITGYRPAAEKPVSKDTLSSAIAPEQKGIISETQAPVVGETAVIFEENSTEKPSFTNQSFAKKEGKTTENHIRRSSSDKLLWFILGLLFLILVLFLAMVLLISWIFVPFAVALRIMLWTLAAIVAVNVVLIIIGIIYG